MIRGKVREAKVMDIDVVKSGSWEDRLLISSIDVQTCGEFL